MWQPKENEFAETPAATRSTRLFVVLFIFFAGELSLLQPC